MYRRKILIVDDSLLNREILADILSDTYDVEFAGDGIEALQILDCSFSEFSLVLLDLVMPKADGFEVLEEMNKKKWVSELPVIVVSADFSSDSINRAYNLGVADYIVRPINTFIVKRRVQNTILSFEKEQKMAAIIAEEIFNRMKSNEIMVSILSQVVEFRNQESGLHIVHIRLITELLLEAIKRKTDRYDLNKERFSSIVMGSALHDIGKIAIPDFVLNKPGKLTEEEFELIKTHPIVGANLVRRADVDLGSPLVAAVYEICRWHHERWDGGGYPDKLEGDAIPISAQVVALADVYDALTSERCYKEALSHNQAIQMIIDGQCGAFNPLLLECLQEVEDSLPDLLALSESVPDEEFVRWRFDKELLKHGDYENINLVEEAIGRYKRNN